MSNAMYPDNPPKLPKEEADLNKEVRILFAYILGITESVDEDQDSVHLCTIIGKIRNKIAALLGEELE